MEAFEGLLGPAILFALMIVVGLQLVPDDFRREDHGLDELRVSTRGGAVFATFSPTVESFEDGSLVLSGAYNSFSHRQIWSIQTNLNGCVGTNGSGSECHNTDA